MARGSIALRTLNFKWSGKTGGAYHETKKTGYIGDVHEAQAAIQSFSLGYDDEDHHIWKEELEASASNQGGEVKVDFTGLIRDSSGHIDDAFYGDVDVLVIATLD